MRQQVMKRMTNRDRDYGIGLDGDDATIGYLQCKSGAIDQKSYNCTGTSGSGSCPLRFRLRRHHLN